MLCKAILLMQVSEGVEKEAYGVDQEVAQGGK